MAGAFQRTAFQDNAFQIDELVVAATATTAPGGIRKKQKPEPRRKLYIIEGQKYLLTPAELQYVLAQVVQDEEPAEAVKTAQEAPKPPKAPKPTKAKRSEAPPAPLEAAFPAVPSIEGISRALRIQRELAEQDALAAQAVAALIQQAQQRAEAELQRIEAERIAYAQWLEAEDDDETILLLIA